jgi:cytochrome c-type biogenesis protein CcmH/NrfF
MTRRLLLLLLVLAAVAPGTALAAAPRASLPDIEDEVMCVECGTALNISEAPSADRERAFIRRRIAEGLDKQQIKDALVAEYGSNVLGTPPDKGFNVAVWLVPAALALAAVAAVWTTARRWRRAGRGGADDDGGADPELDPEDARRLERDMAGYDL